jgi:SAM-dependent methyltransferase
MHTIKDAAVAMYSTLADYYDALVGDDEAVQEWVSWIDTFAPKGSFLELACGSGEITLQLAKTRKVEALDLSQNMVDHARSKDAEGRIAFHCCNMLDLSGFGTYDAVGCFCDSINYLLEDSQMETFFKECADHLKPGGILLFDTHSLDRIEEFEEGYDEAGQFEDGTQVQWLISSENDLIYQDFTFYFEDEVLIEHHLQRVYTPKQLEKWIEPYFTTLSIKTDFDTEGIAPGEKYFYALQKK